jgi:hypothetical protein
MSSMYLVCLKELHGDVWITRKLTLKQVEIEDGATWGYYNISMVHSFVLDDDQGPTCREGFTRSDGFAGSQGQITIRDARCSRA